MLLDIGEFQLPTYFCHQARESTWCGGVTVTVTSAELLWAMSRFTHPQKQTLATCGTEKSTLDTGTLLHRVPLCGPSFSPHAESSSSNAGKWDESEKCFEQSLATILTSSILKMRLGGIDASSVGAVHLNAHFKRIKLNARVF